MKLTRTTINPAPKDNMITFIGVCPDYPWPTIMLWNEHDDAWVYSMVGVCEMEDGTLDSWFENEQTKTITAWAALPEPWREE